jgi:ATP-dependent DNA helicase RecQ
VIEHLLFEGVLSEGDSERPTLSVGDDEAARAIFRTERVIRMREAAKPAPRRKADRRAVRDGRASARAGFSGDDAKMFEALRVWRLEIAHAAGVPPYVIFHDATLAAIVEVKPPDMAALGRVNGIGEAKLKRHGTDLLSIVIAGV